ncbi:hypothetical protein PLESTB_000468300 [Pleodorina starrii]|uniref:Uncharacterized protein n=1 Tax=Pleodorina starrii TaxID=330485 RepID=A0A9W6BFJ2_9CHLO|nr:hypothetical protein PLESTM_001598600 [Pleodorina starrii]GLC51123.1 hypothetical protein PLESTB_000468300 [Pleodorina starrii]GLC63480.1 hypothetical protein PLESTF_000040700 [Pleodorina starrii]
MIAHTLVDLCCRVIAGELLRGEVPANFPADVSEPELLIRVYDLYKARFQSAPPDHAALLRHLLVLQAFSEEWQLQQLRLPLPQPRTSRALSQLHLVASRLRHLELTEAAWMTDLTFLHAPPPLPPTHPHPHPHPPPPHPPTHQTHPLHQPAGGITDTMGGGGAAAAAAAQPLPAASLQLTCLALRGCRSLPPAALGQGLLGLASSLRVLELSGAERLDDSAAGVLAALSCLQVLNLNYTAVGDPTLAALTYGARARAWSRSAGAPPPAEAAAWPELSIQRWHLAGTRVTGSGLALLADTAQLHFLDVRGAGVIRAALRPLERRFGLTLVQGAVLATSNALAAALVNHAELLACGCSAEQLAALGPTTSAASAARERRRQQAQRMRAQRGLPAPAAVRGGGDDDGVVERRGEEQAVVRWEPSVASGSGRGTEGLVAGVPPQAWGRGGGEGGAGGVAGAAAGWEADWQQHWATQGIAEMVDTCEHLLRLEAQLPRHHGWG